MGSGNSRCYDAIPSDPQQRQKRQREMSDPFAATFYDTLADIMEDEASGKGHDHAFSFTSP
eukprot:1571041-Alexandrium_andersonii.AAC.1